MIDFSRTDAASSERLWPPPAKQCTGCPGKSPCIETPTNSLFPGLRLGFGDGSCPGVFVRGGFVHDSKHCDAVGALTIFGSIVFS